MSAPEPSPDLPVPAAVCDGGDLDCGSGLLLIIRKAMAPLEAGEVLEVRSREPSVAEDLPAWCRMVGHGLLGVGPGEDTTRYAIRKRGADAELNADLETARAFVWRARVRWREGMLARAYVRNHSLDLGQPASFDTEDPAPSAVEALLSALGASLTVGLQWRCSKAGIAVHELELSLRARADNILVFLGLDEQGSPGFSRIEGRAYIDAEAPDERLRALWDETLARCPVAASLRAELALTLEPV